jgi:hypothetical protein
MKETELGTENEKKKGDGQSMPFSPLLPVYRDRKETTFMILFVARRKVVLQSFAQILAKFHHRNQDTNAIVFIASSSSTQNLWYSQQ